MSLGTPRAIYGVNSVTPYSRVDGTPYGTVKVVEDSSINLSTSLVELTGGSQKYPWAVEEGLMKAEMSLKLGAWPDFVYQLFLGLAPTENGGDALGNCSALVNKKGTSMVAATGLASIGIKTGSETSLKFGKYVLVAASATTVNVYFMSDTDIYRGSAGAYQDDTLKVTVSALTITAATPTDIPNFGLTLTGGAGTIAMVVGDTATFMVRPKNTKSMSVDIGGNASQVFPEFGCIVMANKRNTGEMYEVDCYRCKGSGSHLGFTMDAWAKNDIKIMLMYDDQLDKVLSIRHVTPLTVN